MTLENKKILVTGGSGSLGREIIKKLLTYRVKEVVSISRDEALIKEAEIEITSKKVRFEIGDICDARRVKEALVGVDIVFHTAAMKHVALAEKFPRELLRINILGLLNLLENSQGVSRFINASSDKAIGAINTYGASKIFAESLVREANSYQRGKFYNVRCPNFIGSRGSVIDLWKQQIKETNTISITNPLMTRYFITLKDAAKYLVALAIKSNFDPQLCYFPKQNVRKFRLADLAKAFCSVFGNLKTKIIVTGSQPGEKINEDYLCEVKLASATELKRTLRDL